MSTHEETFGLLEMSKVKNLDHASICLKNSLLV